MNATIKLVNPDEMKAEICLTSTIGQFRKLNSILNAQPSNWQSPMAELRTALRSVISKAEQQLESKEEKV